MLLREILDALPVLIFLERAGQLIYANAEARHAMGMGESDWVQRPVEDVVWGLFAGTAEPQTLLSGTASGNPFHATLACAGGRIAQLEGSYHIVDPETREGVIVAHLSGRERSPKPRLMEDVLASIPEAVAILHNGHVLYTNPAFTEMFGFSPDEVSGGDLRDFIVPETRQHEHAALQKMVSERGRGCIETVRVTNKGELVDVAMQIAPLLVSGSIAGQVLTYRDIGDRKQVEAKLQHDSIHDVLTGLPNRALFQDHVQLALSRRARRGDQGCGVLFLDVDDFREINSTLGHAAGDLFLAAVAQRLRRTVRPQDTAARLGGDEFAILVENVVSTADLEIVGKRVLAELDRPFEISGHRVTAGVSIGAALAGYEHTASELLIRDVDLAMFRAKEAGGHRIEIFDNRMKAQVSARQARERELRHVLARREFELWYQPIFQLATGQVEGFEALLRWRRADGSIDSFRDLLPIAEDSGLSISIGRDTMDAACRQLQSWTASIPGHTLSINLNVTLRQFYSDDLAHQIGNVLDATGAEPARLVFEVSENTINSDPDRAVGILQRMVDCGVRLAIDNFGSTLAPLNHLFRLPLDLVKLDPKLTAAATSAGRQLAMVESLIQVCRSLGVRLLAQGIETHEQLRVWQGLGCELGQGYLLSPALDPTRAQMLVVRDPRAIASNA